MFWRLFGTFGVLVAISIALVGGLLLPRFEQAAQARIHNGLHETAILVSNDLRNVKDTRELQPRVLELAKGLSCRITLLDEKGYPLADSQEDPKRMERHDLREEILQARQTGFATATRKSATLGVSMTYGALHLAHSPGAVAFFRVAVPEEPIQAELADLKRTVWTVAALTAVTAMALAFVLAQLIVRPLHELTVGAERVAAGAYGHKVYVGGRDEVAALVRAFNRMSERLAVQFQELENDRQQLRTILSGMVEGVIAIDADQRILFANERANQLLDVHDHPVIGRRLWEAVRQRSLHDIVKRALAGPGPHSEELQWNGRTAKSLTVHADCLSGNGSAGAVLVIHDTTELRRLERLRQDFVANVSHELKTPLSVIKVCVETLLDGAVDDLQHREGFLQQVAEQAERLHSLILDLLSLSRIEAGTEAFAFQSVPLADLVNDCLERHRARAEGKGQHLEAVPPPEDVSAWADEEAVSQILENLVDNALKYTPKGGRIQVRWRAADGHITLEVEDTGIGIPDADLPRIFERFYRVDKARSRELGGTGLGLSIVKHLAQAMKGTVEAHSQLGQGTTFCVRLPAGPV